MTREKAIEILHFQTFVVDFQTGKALEMAISALRQQERFGEANKALNLDDLRKMEGEPVWVVWPDGRIKSKWWIVNSGLWMDMFLDDHGNISNDYGTVWLAYSQEKEV